jgi:hypothetical protein
MAEQDTGQQPHGWVLAFLLVETGGTAEKVHGTKVWIGLLETLCAEAWLRAESMRMRPKLQE